MARMELVLYAGLTPTGVIEYSETSDTGPWTSVQLTETAPVTDALADWADQIATATSLTVDFSWDGAAVVLTASGPLWIRWTATLAELLGFADRVQDSEATATSDETPTGIAEVLVGTTSPTEREEAELDEYRAARSASYHYGRAGDVQVDIGVPPDLYAATSTSPLWSGHGAFKLTPGSNTDPYGEDDLDGTLLVFPHTTSQPEQEREEDYLHVTITGSMLDPGDTLPTEPASPTRWQILMGGIRYGYTRYHVVRVEGSDKLLHEALMDAVAPSGYFFEDTHPEGWGPLVVDRTARNGSLIDDQTCFAKAFDQELRFLDTPGIRVLFGTRPTTITTLTADIDADDTTLPVADSTDLGSVVYVGTSRIPVAGRTLTSLTGATRGSYGRARSYKAGTLVTNAPYIWRGRRVEIFVVMLDPTGRFVQTANILDTSCALWAGYVQERPFRDGTEWVLRCRDQVRRLAQPLGVAASGKARWSVNDDVLVKVDLNAVINVSINGDGNLEIENVSVRPFFGQTGAEGAGAGLFRASEVRKLVADALEAAWASDVLPVGRPFWVIDAQTGLLPGAGQSYKLKVPVDLDGDDSSIIVKVTEAMDAATSLLLLVLYGTTVTGVSGTAINDIPIDIQMQPPIGNVTLTVLLDDAEPSEIPEAGWVVLEGEGSTDYRRYTSFVVDPNDPLAVTLTLDPRDRPSASQFRDLTGVDAQDGQAADVSAKFYWKASGKIYDVLRRAIVSSGDAVNGSYDTLPKGQGLGLPDIDEDSFTRVFDAAFQDLTLNMAAESGTSLEDQFSGILRLSQRGLAARRAADGSAVQIAAVSLGSATGGSPVATITDATLVSSSGRRPIRVLDVFAGPQAIECKCRTVPVGDTPGNEGSIILRDPHLTDWTGDRWALDINGISRDSLRDPAIAWATSLFRGGENRQIIEVDVPPWIDAQPGDVVALDVTDPNLWDYAAGGPGLDTLGRVLGCQFSMVTGVQTLTVAVDGILSAGPMCPSLPILAVNESLYFYRSDGASGSYADASTNVAAELLVPPGGTFTANAWTFAAWVRPSTDAGSFQYVMKAKNDVGGQFASLYWSGPDESDNIVGQVTDMVDSTNTVEPNPSLVVDEWHHVALVNDAAADTLRLYLDGVEVSTASTATVNAALPGGDLFTLFDSGDGERLTGDERAPAGWSRALSASELADIVAEGPAFDLTTTTGAYVTADPVVLWDTADVAGVVANRGSGGTCDLAFHGGVTSEVL